MKMNPIATWSAFCVLAALAFTPACAADLTVMTFNIWGAAITGKDIPPATLDAIRKISPDVLAIQEARTGIHPCTDQGCPPREWSDARKIAAALGYYAWEASPPANGYIEMAVLTKAPAAGTIGNGVLLDVGGKRVAVLNVHLAAFPYQPYQLTGITYGEQPFLKTPGDAVLSAQIARGGGVQERLSAAEVAGPADATLLMGDFNEPSHRDWTDATAAVGYHPLAVAWPSAKRVEGAGFVDVYRAVHPDPVRKPGFTWTPKATKEPAKEHHDRIDFIFAKSPTLEVLDAGVVGERWPLADVVISPWPSDHRAVYARIRF